MRQIKGLHIATALLIALLGASACGLEDDEVPDILGSLIPVQACERLEGTYISNALRFSTEVDTEDTTGDVGDRRARDFSGIGGTLELTFTGDGSFQSVFTAPGLETVLVSGAFVQSGASLQLGNDALFPDQESGPQNFTCRAVDGGFSLESSEAGFDFDNDGTFEEARFFGRFEPASGVTDPIGDDGGFGEVLQLEGKGKTTHEEGLHGEVRR